MNNILNTSEQVGGSHYRKGKIQPIEYILANDLGFCEGNVIKYITRYKHKGGIEDLLKARQYIDFLIAEKGNVNHTQPTPREVESNEECESEAKTTESAYGDRYPITDPYTPMHPRPRAYPK